MISAIGRKPARASPAETPAIAASLIGVARTRAGKSVLSPRVTLKAPAVGVEDVLAEHDHARI